MDCLGGVGNERRAMPVLAEPSFAGDRIHWSRSVPAAPAVLPRDAEGLEVVLAMRVTFR